jgi:hypothetical protein
LDGRRFLLIKRLDDSQGSTTAMSAVIAQKWFEEPKRLTAAK